MEPVMLGIRVTRAEDEWLYLAALACQPFFPLVSYDVLTELLEEHARLEASRRDDEWRAFPASFR